VFRVYEIVTSGFDWCDEFALGFRGLGGGSGAAPWMRCRAKRASLQTPRGLQRKSGVKPPHSKKNRR